MNSNNDESLSLGEVWMYIEGAKPTKQDRENVLEGDIKKDMDEQINDLFNEFKDESKNVTKESMQRILTGFDIPINVISKSLAAVHTDNDGKISKKNFKKYMTDFLKEMLYEAEQDVNELRAMFYEADLNNSGFLDMDEMYNFFNVKLEANVSRDELRDLVKAVDLDFDGQLDIEEFINLMTKKPSDRGASGSVDATYMRIKRSRKFDMTEFIKFLKKFPDHFQESFSARLYRNKHCLPSSAFLSSIIPHDEQSLKVSKKIKAEPTVKTSEPLIAAQILLELAKGVPHPEKDKIAIGEISKRVVRTTIYDFDSKKFIGNSSYVVGEYNEKYMDQWKFNKWGDTGTNPLIFRTDMQECIDKNICIIFEFVIYCKQDKYTSKELSCGWCKLPVKSLMKKTGKATLEIEGGSPELLFETSFLDKNKKKVKSQAKLNISFRGLKDFSDESQFHFKMLPDICIFQKRLIAFIIGFRNYLGRERFGDIHSGEAMTLPNSNYMIVTFPKILDNPDACESFLTYWNDNVAKKLKEKEKFDIAKLIELTETQISKMYPVLYSTSFELNEFNVELAAECFIEEPELKDTRRLMITNALNNRPLNFVSQKDKNSHPVNFKSTYRPFNIRELDAGKVVYSEEFINN